MKYTLKAIRINNGFTQNEAAKKLGISLSALINYENGKTLPNVAVIKKMEKVYNTTYDEIEFLQA